MSSPVALGATPVGVDRGALHLLNLVRRSGALTRAQMNEQTGWARMTVTGRLEQLLAERLLVADDPEPNGRGRPATRFRVAGERAALLVADVGALGARLARCDLLGKAEQTADRPLLIGDGPDVVLPLIRSAMEELTADLGNRPVWGVGMSLPGPVESDTGRVVRPPIMTGWDGVVVRELVSDWFGTPVLVDNDVNAMAVGEQAVSYPDAADLFVIKVGTGVGSGIISNGHVLRGVSGAAGDIGHTWADTEGIRTDSPECRCGKRGCVEAYCGGWAIARDASLELGRPLDVDDVVALLGAGDPVVLRLTRDAGRILGGSVATAVSLLNPSAVVLGGQVAAAAREHLLAGLRERIYARSLPLATRDLPIEVSTLWPDAGVQGLARGVADLIFSPAS